MEKFANWLRRYSLAIFIHVLVIALWQFWVVLGDVPSYVAPTPVDTAMAIFSNYDWTRNTLVTAAEIFGGYFLAVIFGVGLALIFSWSRILSSTFMPLIVSANMIPKVALGPIIIVWFSYGLWPNIMIAFSICFLPILLTTERGLSEVEPDLLDLVRSLKGSRWQIFTKIQLPGSLPYIFSGMKVAVVLAVAGAIVGEFIASEEGLGYLMLQVQVTLDTAASFLAVFLITLVGVALYAIVLILERLFVVGDRRLEGSY
ncbi:ABC transporter permease [Oceanibacterium hippocampi]|uniref:Putative aliphatic sulfonates transport permease protein SsuC n=1 Tax=Oceanibacterium hippocampi TaxID=745714 RepID=A0A1Y5RYK6_9PROT|nr:ABC transporter permease [Oceanibacterium hippocampi]SLN27952.1 Putative aliphatic sulfonates transport permease protein SsuC [Oceanibacterium hippocampi]